MSSDDDRLYLIDRGGGLRVPFCGTLEAAKTRARALALAWRCAVAIVDPTLLASICIVEVDEACAPGAA